MSVSWIQNACIYPHNREVKARRFVPSFFDPSFLSRQAITLCSCICVRVSVDVRWLEETGTVTLTKHTRVPLKVYTKKMYNSLRISSKFQPSALCKIRKNSSDRAKSWTQLFIDRQSNWINRKISTRLVASQKKGLCKTINQNSKGRNEKILSVLHEKNLQTIFKSFC